MKDPAFLFYSSDFLTGTMLMSNEEVGIYIRLLCLQHQQGHLNKSEITSMGVTEKILSKFKQDEEGNYYNERLEIEAIKRKKFTESRRNNRQKKTYEKDMKNICNSYVEHMENENININENGNKKEKDNRGMGKEEKEKKKPKEQKKHFAEFVTMTNAEYEKLVGTYGKEFTDQCITVLDNYKGANGKKYKSDYRAILNWVVEKVSKSTKQTKKSIVEEWLNNDQN